MVSFADESANLTFGEALVNLHLWLPVLTGYTWSSLGFCGNSG